MGETLYFGTWRIQYNPKPIPDRRNDWDYWKDGMPDIPAHKLN